MNHSSAAGDNAGFPARLAILGLLLLPLVGGCSQLRTAWSDWQFTRLEEHAEDAYRHGDFPLASEEWQRGIDVARAQGHTEQEARCLIGLARVAEGSGRYRDALDYATSAVAATRRCACVGLEGRALVELGQAQQRLSQSPDARRSFGAALELARQNGDQQLACNALKGMGTLAQSGARPDEAVRSYADALTAARAAGDPLCEAQTLNDLGGVYRSLAEYQRAITYYDASLEIRRRLDDVPGRAKVLGNLCNVYSQLNEYDTAIRSCQQSLELARDLGARATEANMLNTLGAIDRERREWASALAYYQQALALKREIGDRGGEARTLQNIGEVSWQLGRTDDASASLQQALALATDLGDVAGQAAAHQTLGAMAGDRADYEVANEQFRQALTLAAEARAPEVRWRAFDGLSMAAAAQGNPALAILFGKQSVNTIQSMRSNVTNLDQALQRSFLEDKIHVYRRVATLLIDEGRFWEAEQVLGMLKDEEFFHFVRGSAESRTTSEAPLTNTEAQWAERYQQIADHLIAIGQQRRALQQKPARTAAEEQQLKALDDDIGVGRKAYLQFMATLKDEFDAKTVTDIRQQAESWQGRTLRGLGPGTVRIDTVVAKERYSVILTTADTQVAGTTPITAQELNRKVFAFREALQHPERDPLPLAQELYTIVLGPVRANLDNAKVDTLVWSLDGVLRYIPMAALYDGHQYMAQRYETVVISRASEARLHRSATKWKGLGFGVSKARPPEFPALPAVPDELKGIFRERDTGPGVVPGSVLLDEKFTRQQFENGLKTGPPLVHIATHFKLTSGSEERSFLLLGDGSELTLQDIDESTNLFEGVELLTLSACNTAMGDPGATGDGGSELDGFAAIAQLRGAEALIASLWPVSDASTRLLMEEFYRAREQKPDGMTKAAALRRAQQALLSGTLTDAAPPGGQCGQGRAGEPTAPSYAHPYYWAPFILIGNWQ